MPTGPRDKVTIRFKIGSRLAIVSVGGYFRSRFTR